MNTIKRIFFSSALLAAFVALAAPAAFGFQEPDFAQDVSRSSDPSPRDAVTGSSVDQFGAGQTDSQVDNYVYQDEQINLDADSGVVRVLRTNQKALVNEFVGAAFRLNHVVPREIRELARTVVRKEGGAARVFKNKEPDGLYAGIHVVCPEFQLPYLEKTFAALDKSWIKEAVDGSWTIYYKAKHRDIRDIMEIMIEHSSPEQTFTFDQANNAVVLTDQPYYKKTVMMGFNDIDIPPNMLTLSVEIHEVDTQNDLSLGFDFESWINGPGRALAELIYWDYDGNAQARVFPGSLPDKGPDWGYYYSYDFTITTAYLDFLRAKGRARLLTRATLAAKSGTAAELSAVDEIVNFSVDFNSEPGAVEGAHSYQLADLYDDYYERGEIFPSLSSLLNREQPNVGADAVIDHLLYFLEEVVEVEADSLERLALELQHRAAIDGSLTRADVSRTFVPVPAILRTFRDRATRYLDSGRVGVLFSILPVVGLGDEREWRASAETAIALDVSEVGGFTPSGDPIIEHRFFSSTVNLVDNKPLVLGGFRRTAKVRAMTGVPFLIRVPFLKYLFGRKVTTTRQKELVVVMTPSIRTHTMDTNRNPRQIRTEVNLARTEADLDIPWTPFGFDQWLLDGIHNPREVKR